MPESAARSALQRKHRSSFMTSSSPRIICRGSSSSEVSEESSCSNGSAAAGKPHKSNDGRWEAIQAAGPGGTSFRHYRLLTKLGSGDIGTVYLAELAGTSSLFAMKIMDKSSLAGRKKLLRAQTERDILQILDHPFLPTLYSHFESERFSCLVMEFCPGGDLHCLRQRQPGKRFSEPAAKFYLAEILLALEYLHMLGIVYRDLKPENVLVREDGHIMLSDFDLSLRCFVSPTVINASPVATDVGGGGEDSTCAISTACFSPRFLQRKKTKKKELGNQVTPLPELVAEPTDAKSMSFVGTHEYLAPEIIKGEGHGSAVDWWTTGIFLYELLFGKTPFKGSGNRATLFNVMGMPLKFPEGNFPASFAAKDLIRGLLEKEPGRRLGGKRGATEIKQHPFFEGVNWALVRCAAPPEIPPPVEHRRAPPPREDGKKEERSYLEFEFF